MLRFAAICLFLLASLTAQAQVPQSRSEISLSFAPVVKAAAPAVVNIYAKKLVPGRVSPFAGDPFFNRFFGPVPSRPRVENSLGSGVILTADGIIVSNYHVVGEAAEIRVVLADKREFDADVLLAGEAADLAILQLRDVDSEALPFLPMADSDGVEVGDLVLAIGNPFGVGQTVTSGIVSGLARSAGIGAGEGTFIQTDAAINPGNSGGALVTVTGDLLGVNTAILTRSGGSNGIGFAIPSNLIAAYLGQALDGASAFAQPWAGMAVQSVDAAMAQALGLEQVAGVVISEMHPQSPFAEAGLQVGDVIASVGGIAVESQAELLFRMATHGRDQAIVDYLRGGVAGQAMVALGPAPDEPAASSVLIEERSPLQGAQVARINPAIIQSLDLPLAASGVVVLNADGYARRFGLREGDVILGINGVAVELPEDVLIRAGDRTRAWQIDILRGGQRTQLRFRI